MDRELRILAGHIAGLVWKGLALVVPGTLLWQVYRWLETGRWAPLSVNTLLYLFGPDELAGWAQYPSSWLGVWKILEFLHVSVVFIPFIVVAWNLHYEWIRED